MLKVAILDDYQNIAKDFIDLKKLSSKYEFQVFNDPFENEDDAIEKLPKLTNPSGELSASSDLQRIFNLTDKEAQRRTDYFSASDLFLYILVYLFEYKQQ